MPQKLPLKSATARSAIVVACVLILALINGCSASINNVRSTAPSQSKPTQIPAQTLIAQLEQRLLQASAIEISSTIQASGAINVQVSGIANIATGNHASWDFSGTFIDKTVDVALLADGQNVHVGPTGAALSVAVGAQLNKALILGMTRMGLLHNIARMTASAPPDHMQADVETWVQLINFREYALPGLQAPAQTRPISFDLIVANQPAGSATLWLHKKTGLPVQRDQLVNFPEGEMRVVEYYEAFVVNN